MKWWLFAFSLVIWIVGFGQKYEAIGDILVSNGVQQLKFPFTGGFNAPQFSSVDLNGDGFKDLHIFDRVGDVQLTFLNTGKSGFDTYVYAPEFVSVFPELFNWVLLRDYDGDGIEDIFTYSDIPGISGVAVYKGKRVEKQIFFERVIFDHPFNLLYFRLNGGSEIPVFISSVDYPAVDDLDCDGDLDILTFNVSGGYIELYANQSQELGFGNDTLIFRLADNCWGGVFESGLSELLDLSASPGQCPFRLQKGPEISFRHSGSTLLTVDMDADGDKELFLGDITFNNINLLKNGGSCSSPWLNEQEPFFPKLDVQVNLPSFPALFFLDLNNDGNKDLLASPNIEIGGEDKNLIWIYQNNGSADQPFFEFRQKNFLVDQTIDLGTGCNPAFVDYNGDGLMDIVVGNNISFDQTARVVLFENVGDLDKPAYKLVDEDYLSVSRFAVLEGGFAPRFRDLDGDKDLDLIIGLEFGGLLFAENLAGAGNPLSFAPWQEKYMDIDIGFACVAEIYDANQDELPDLFLGERDGKINYFENRGSKGSPLFEKEPDDSFWGKVDTRSPGFITGFSVPYIFIAETGQPQLLTGSRAGNIKRYAIETGDEGFTLIDSDLGQIQVGEQINMDLANIDADPFLEMVVGNLRGGMAIYKTDLIAQSVISSSSGKLNFASDLQIRFFPNPANASVVITLPNSSIFGNAPVFDLSIFDNTGRLFRQLSGIQLPFKMDINDYPKGVYWVVLKNQNGNSGNLGGLGGKLIII